VRRRRHRQGICSRAALRCCAAHQTQAARVLMPPHAQATMDISLDSLARRGIFVSFGNASGAVPPFPVLRLIGKSAYVTR